MTDRSGKSFVRDIAHSVIVPGSRVVRSAEIAHVGGKSASHTASTSIEIVTEENIVRAIDVTCECGHKIRLWCSYETDANERNPAEAS